MKIILLANSDWSIYNFRVPLALELRKMGHEVIMMSPDGNFVSKIEDEGFRHIAFPLSRTGMNPLREMNTIRVLTNILRKERPHVIHSFTPKGVLYGSTAAKICRVDIIVNSITGLGYLFEINKKSFSKEVLKRIVLGWYKMALRNTKIIFQNEEDLAFFKEKNILKNEDSYLIKSSGVNLDKFAPHYTQEETPIVALPARMIKAKGVETFAEAARILKKGQNVNARFVLAGSLDLSREDSLTKEQIKGWEREGFIEWWGYQEDMPAFYKKVSIVCLPSFGKEGVPRTLIEAAAAGKPIITTDNTGCRDAVVHGESGYLIPVKDPLTLSEKILLLLENASWQREMGQQGRILAEENFSLNSIGLKTEEIYRKTNKQ